MGKLRADWMDTGSDCFILEVSIDGCGVDVGDVAVVRAGSEHYGVEHGRWYFAGDAGMFEKCVPCNDSDVSKLVAKTVNQRLYELNKIDRQPAAS